MTGDIDETEFRDDDLIRLTRSILDVTYGQPVPPARFSVKQLIAAAMTATKQPCTQATMTTATGTRTTPQVDAGRTPAATNPTRPCAVPLWNGAEVRMLREARRLSVREFATHLGVSHRVVSSWEAGGVAITPRPVGQSVLSMSLRHADVDVKLRFLAAYTAANHPETDQASESSAGTGHTPYPRPSGSDIDPELWNTTAMRQALAVRDIAAVFRTLQDAGYSQQRIAALCQQNQSEVSEILNGRDVTSYDLLTRIADGLGVPRGFLGLAYCTCHPDPPPTSHHSH